MINITLLDSSRIPKYYNEVLKQSVSTLGNFIDYPSTNLDNIITNAYNAEIILTNKAQLDKSYFKQLPNLRYVIVTATGYDCIDILSAREYNVHVSNVPNYSTQIVAQHTIALILELTNQVGKTSSLVRQNKWTEIKHMHTDLAGKTLGVIGFGNIAKQVIKTAIALGLNVLVSSTRNDYITNLPVTFVSTDELFKQSDIISLHCPYNEQTKHLINKKSLELMKPNSILINTSRGGLIHEEDLAHALKHERIAAAGLDVLNTEPPNQNNILFDLPNCIITPHNAWLSKNSAKLWCKIIVDNIIAYKQNNLINLVN